jgi:hypothetical protein
MRAKTSTLVIAALLAGSTLAPSVASAQGADPLAQGFQDPPNSARPRVWWHWMNGNVTRDGIQKDIDWMSRVGIGGLQNFDAALETPQIVPHRLSYMTPEWKDAFRYAATLADQKGLELAIAASPGWSETGGPWVQPRDGMKKLVWSETEVAGGQRFTGRLAPPPTAPGPFQDTRVVQHAATSDTGKPLPVYYADAVVLAYRVADKAAPLPLPAYAVNGTQPAAASLLTDGSYQAGIDVPRGTPDAPGFVTISYAAPQTVRSATIAIGELGRVFRDANTLPQLQVSQDGASWRKVADLPIKNGVPTTVSFAPVTASLFRIVFQPNAVEDVRARLGASPGAIVAPAFTEQSVPVLSLRELRLSGAARIDQFEAKAGFSVVDDYYGLAGVQDDAPGVAAASVIDLGAKMRSDGTLDWTPPPGRWRVLRMGYSLTGTVNHPATVEATGLEVDKYDRAAVHDYMEKYIATYADTTGPGLIGQHGLKAIVTDSIETGPSNWTRDMVGQFKRLRGYDPTPWLPALTGVIIGSRAESDAFLYDFRRTLADLTASEHYGEVSRVVHEHGLTLYGEALESERPSLGDDIAMRRYADLPMAAMWTWQPGSHVRYTLLADDKGAASVAHLYGQNLVAAESMTAGNAPWAFAPSDLKPVIDLEFAQGINRPVIHTSVHQPVDDKVPGLSLSIFGQYFNRHETWAEMARPWVDYMARSSYLLQQGRYFADVAYFFGEEAPLTALFNDGPDPHAPRHYGYDYVDPDGVLNQLSVEKGDLVARSGARYRLLYLGGSSRRMTVAMLRRIEALADAGATIVGERPSATPSLADKAEDFTALTGRLWGGGAVTHVGQGQVIAGADVEKALQAMGVAPDVAFDGAGPDSQILFVHRKLADADIYYVNNRLDRPETINAAFRVSGEAAELWHAESGTAEPVSYRAGDGVTTVPLRLAPHDAVFVMFRKPAQGAGEIVAAPVDKPVLTLDGAWDVAFQPGRGAPAVARLASLQPLSGNSDAGIRYFSGVATYSKSFTLPKGASGGHLMLDLGQVGSVAEVRVNGTLVGTSWHAPYRLDIGAAVKAGANRLEVRVADLWVNRLIGDAQPGAAKITYTTLPTYRADAPLRPSGLIGPVSISQQTGGNPATR